MGWRPSALRRHLEAMVRVRDQVKCRATAEAGDDRLQQGKLRQRIASARHEEHRDLDLRKMLSPVDAGPPSRMEWKSDENQSANARQRRFRLCLGRHSPAERAPARE